MKKIKNGENVEHIFKRNANGKFDKDGGEFGDRNTEGPCGAKGP